MKPELRWLDEPDIFRVGQLAAHSDHKFYETEEDCRAGKETLYQSLNGTWQFCWSPNTGQRPADFYREDFDASGFTTIPVPGHMELSGFDRIHYINTMYPWEGHLYRRPAYSMKGVEAQAGQFSGADYNPVGSYRLTFDLDEGLCGKRVCVSFEGVEQAMYLWLNGHFVGYAEDSFTPSDFDLTPYIRERKNVMAVEVHKQSTAAYLEDQDFFRFSGIFRNVTLYAKPQVHIEDLWVKPVLNDDNRSGSLALELKLSAASLAGCTVLIRLMDAAGVVVLENRLQAEEMLSMRAERLAEVTPWDHRVPYLYRLELQILSPGREIIEVVPYPVGFRRIALRDGIMELNGTRLIINGVNRHEWNARTGRAITGEDMRWDLDCFHENKINSVRTCHYPDQIPWYFLCDAEGISVMAEANLESHGSWQKMGAVEPSWNVPGDCPKWREAVVDRVRTNFETFKNHASVLFWSLGNESYAGDDIRAMSEYLRDRDDGRLIHYEGVFHNRCYEAISDMESQMYAPPKRVEEYLERDQKKPFIMCEYMHSMGNSVGGMKSYIDLIDRYDRYQGGYIWDFIDQALWVTDEITGKQVLRYGGDFDDRPSDYEFSGNGIVFADRVSKPAMQEVKYYYGLHK